MATARTKILLVEDDARIREELMTSLGEAGFDIDVSLSYQDACWAARRAYDLILLDLGLPDGDGLDLCTMLRRDGRSVPIIVLTARDSPNERVRGLDHGADDYVVKPFHVPELLARIRSVLRRAGRSVGPGALAWGDLRIDPEARVVKHKGKEVKLTRREFDLLLFFMRYPSQAWTRAQLLERVWGAEFHGDPRTIDLHVRRLRSKIEDDPGDPRYVRTVWGVGYRFGE